MVRRDCEWIEKKLSAYVDEELSHREATEVYLHLRECDSCRQEERKLQFWKCSLEKVWQPHPFGEALKSRILSAVQTQSSPVRRPFWLIPLTVAAALLIWVALFPLFHSQSFPKHPWESESVTPVATRVVSGTQVSQKVDELPKGTILSVPPGSGNEQLVWYDGSRVILEGGAKIKILSRRGVRLYSGRALFQIHPRQRRELPFRVLAYSVTIEVVGTQFLVTVKGGVAWVELLEGKLRIQKDGKTFHLRAGQGMWLQTVGSHYGFYSLEWEKLPRWVPRPKAPSSTSPPPRPSSPPPVMDGPKRPSEPTEEPIQTPRRPEKKHQSPQKGS